MSRSDSAVDSEGDGDAPTAESDRLADLPPTDEHPILLFDGVCDLCDSLVQFTIPRDSDATFRFASLQSPVGQALLAAHDLPTTDFDTIVLIEDGTVYAKSEAALRACRHLDGFYPLLRFLLAVPRPVRDRAYDVVAANRYDWFGKKESCLLPADGVRERFLDDGTGPGG